MYSHTSLSRMAKIQGIYPDSELSWTASQILVQNNLELREFHRGQRGSGRAKSGTAGYDYIYVTRASQPRFAFLICRSTRPREEVFENTSFESAWALGQWQGFYHILYIY